jgi:hypothetical protein
VGLDALEADATLEVTVCLQGCRLPGRSPSARPAYQTSSVVSSRLAMVAMPRPAAFMLREASSVATPQSQPACRDGGGFSVGEVGLGCGAAAAGHEGGASSKRAEVLL